MRYLARTERDTEELGARLARVRPCGEALTVVFLSGELGAGKTTLVRGFLRAVGVSATVRSPTYTLVECYPAGSVSVVHADLYRVRDPRELEALGLRDFAQAHHLWLIEWPERGLGHLPAPDVTVAFSVGTDGHTIGATAHSEPGRQWLQELHEPAP